MYLQLKTKINKIFRGEFEKIFINLGNGQSVEIQNEIIFNSQDIYGEPIQSKSRLIDIFLNDFAKCTKTTKEKYLKENKTSFVEPLGRLSTYDNYNSYNLYVCFDDFELCDDTIRHEDFCGYADRTIKTYYFKLKGDAFITVKNLELFFYTDFATASKIHGLSNVESIEEKIKTLESNEPLFNKKFNREKALNFWKDKALKYNVFVFAYSPLSVKDFAVDKTEKISDYEQTTKDRKTAELLSKYFYKEISHHEIKRLREAGYKIVKVRKAKNEQ